MEIREEHFWKEVWLNLPEHQKERYVKEDEVVEVGTPIVFDYYESEGGSYTLVRKGD
jgi:hypothetical protein